MKPETSQIHRILQELQAGWLAGSAAQFAAAFAPQARFVAFDGTTLTGPSEIANFHQYQDRMGGLLDEASEPEEQAAQKSRGKQGNRRSNKKE